MRRPFLHVVLAFLLLALQNEALVHPLGHVGSLDARAQRTEAALPHAAVACAECTLLAAGSDVVPGALAVQFGAAVAVRGALTPFRSRAVAAPVHFASRAPPVLL